MATKFYALLTMQGTAAAETGLCEFCFTEEAQAAACASAFSDIDVERGFVDVTGNEAIECYECGFLPFAAMKKNERRDGA